MAPEIKGFETIASEEIDGVRYSLYRTNLPQWPGYVLAQDAEANIAIESVRCPTLAMAEAYYARLVAAARQEAAKPMARLS